MKIGQFQFDWKMDSKVLVAVIVVNPEEFRQFWNLDNTVEAPFSFRKMSEGDVNFDSVEIQFLKFILTNFRRTDQIIDQFQRK